MTTIDTMRMPVLAPDEKGISVHHLNSGGLKPSPALIFGAMLEVAAGVVTHYRSDLFHDAIALADIAADAQGEFEFFWGIRPSGTDLHRSDRSQVEFAGNRVFHITVIESRPESWVAHVAERIAP